MNGLVCSTKPSGTDATWVIALKDWLCRDVASDLPTLMDWELVHGGSHAESLEASREES